jgi:cytochrome c1
VLHEWIDAPERIKPGVLMPAMKLSGDELKTLTAYLLTLK